MEELIKELRERFPDLSFDTPFDNESISVTGFAGNPELVLTIFADDDKEIEQFKAIPFSDFHVLKGYVSVVFKEKVYVALRSKGILIMNRLKGTQLDINMSYRKSNLRIRIYRDEDSEFRKFTSFFRRTLQTVMTIEGLPLDDMEKVEDYVEDILNSVLFDVNYNYNIFLEPVRFDDFSRRVLRIRRKPLPFPESTITFTYKEYIPELIEYYRIAEQMSYLPFKFLTYFHIIEYFADRSAYSELAKRMTDMIKRPDFSSRMDYYVMQTLNMFKKEASKNQTDRVKLERVLRQYVEIEEIKEFVVGQDIMSYYETDVVFQLGDKTLVLPKLKFDDNNEKAFFESLTNRIYKLRNSVVHSNPDFDVDKAVPFMPSRDNLDKLQYEIVLIHEVAGHIILKSSH